jgi:hypothetical protein
MPHSRRARRESNRHPSLSEQTSSLSSSSRSSVRRRQSRRSSRKARRHHNRAGRDSSESSDEKKGMKLGKRVYKTVEKVEEPVRKLGKVLLWAAPLILAGLEVRHELHHQKHKRRMMEKEYEKAHLDIQLQMNKGDKSESIAIEGSKTHGSAPEKEPEVCASKVEKTCLPVCPQVERRDDRALPLRYIERESLEIYRPIPPMPVVVEAPVQEVWESRRRRIRVKTPGTREVRFPRRRSWSESVHEYEYEES